MLDWPKLWRLFITSLPLQALTMGLVATLSSLVLWIGAPATFTALDWTAYDTWLRHRTPIPVSSSLILVTRDQASETKFGTGQWDRAILARVITEAHEAGAVGIGLDHRLGQASPAQRGGAASDALLVEATRTAGRVVYPFESESPLASDATALGHLLASPSQDHVARAVPLSAEFGAQTVPALGLALFEHARTDPTTTDGNAVVNYVGDGSIGSLPMLSFMTVWEAIDANQDERLNGWFKDKVVVLLPDPTPPPIWVLPSGQSVTGTTIHLHLLNMHLTDNHVYQLGVVSRYLTALLLAGLVAWTLLHVRESHGLMLAGAIMLGYGCVIAAALAFAHLVLPLALPLSAAALVFVGATAWSHLTAGQQRRLIEQDMLGIQQDTTALRNALVLRETRAEALEEDLAAAQAAVAQSTGQRTELTKTAERLQQELADVRTQEETVRQQLTALSQELNGLRATASKPVPLGDAELRQLSEESRGFGIITQSRPVLLRFRDLKRGAKSELPILLLGEPGTGKELFARAAHRLSPRSSKPFIAVNMAAISPELFESEMFGHLRGSFTGATQDRRGYFELANHGTLFLDEIGDLRLDHQGKLLRVLQDKTFYRVGATTPTTVDVRIVAATNRDLQRGVTEGWFREDLYFRLTGLVFRLPSLHERPEDVPALAEHMLAEIARSSGRPVPSLPQDALAVLMRHPWKGNVRELRHSLERAVALSDNQVLTPQDLHLEEPISVRTNRDKQGVLTLPDPASDAAVLDCLRVHEFDMQATAKALGWDRSTVTQRLKGLCFQSLVETGGDVTKTATILAGNPALTRTVELKVNDYYGHLLDCIREFKTADEALSDCKRRFKNLPDRHFKSVETLVRQQFGQR